MAIHVFSFSLHKSAVYLSKSVSLILPFRQHVLLELPNFEALGTCSGKSKLKDLVTAWVVR